MSSIILNICLIILSLRVITMPFIGVLVYFWLSIMNPQSIVYGGMNIRWSLVISILMLLAAIFSRDQLKAKNNSVFTFVILFYLWTCFTTIYAVFPNAEDSLIAFSKTILVFIFTILLTNSQLRLNVLIWIFVFSASVYILREGAYIIVTAGGHLVTGPPNGPYTGNNEVARLFGMTFPFILFLAFHSKKVITRWALWFLVVIDIIAIIGSQSRGALVALIVMTGFVFLESKHKVSLMLGLLIISGLLIFVTSSDSFDQYIDRYNTIDNYDEDDSFQGRVYAWNYGYDAAKSSPIVGYGFGAFQGAIIDTTGKGEGLHRSSGDSYIDAHSVYFEVMGEHGFVGLFFFTSIIIFGFLKARALMRKARLRKETYWHRDLSIAIQAAIIFYSVGGIVISTTYLDIYYLVLAFIVILDSQLKKYDTEVKTV